MLLSHIELLELVHDGVIENVDAAQINGASIDITLGGHLMREAKSELGIVDLQAKESLSMEDVSCKDGYEMQPGEFILAHSREVFNLPNDIAAVYFLKSSQARSGLEHAHAGFCDPSWHSATLTMEFTNISRYHTLLLREGMKAGQMVFYRTTPVPEANSYAMLGQYNGQEKATGSRGIR